MVVNQHLNKLMRDPFSARLPSKMRSCEQIPVCWNAIMRITGDIRDLHPRVSVRISIMNTDVVNIPMQKHNYTSNFDPMRDQTGDLKNRPPIQHWKI